MTDAAPRQRERFAALRARFGKPGFSIQSKLLVMLLSVSFASAAIVGTIGFISGRNSLQASAIDQLTTIRELRVDELEVYMADLRGNVALDSRNLSAQTSSIALNEGFAEAQTRELTPEQEAQLEAYYADSFIPQLEARTGDEFNDTAFIPESAAGRYVQYHYTAPYGGDFDAAYAAGDAGDGSPWSAARERFHDYWTRLIDDLDYEDVLILNLDGDVVYSAYSGVDLGTNLNTGPFRDEPLAEAYREAVRSNSVSTIITIDFSRWIPSLNVPAMWMVSPIGNDERITGILAAQIAPQAVSDVLTGDERWKEQRLGDTGEVYVAGRDELMRSASRLLVEDPEAYRSGVIQAGTSPAIADRAVEVNGTVLIQPVRTQSVQQALLGRSGTSMSMEYDGEQSITAYRPVEIDGLDWVAVAHIESSEAFAPADEFTRNLVISVLALLLGVSLLSLVFAQVFTRPVRKLVDTVREVASGNLDAKAPTGSRDEFGDLGSAFNDLSSSLRARQEIIDEQRDENRKLMLSLVPATVADRVRKGDETIAQDHSDVTIIFTELVGWDEFTDGKTTDESVALLNGLFRAYDEAAEQFGIEKIRTLRLGHLASCGLMVPRVDNVRRAVDFVRELRVQVDRFNAQQDASLAVRAGIDIGTVTSGVVDRSSLAYDLWGDAVSLAYRVQSTTSSPGLFASQRVRERLQDTVQFAEAGTVDTPNGRETVWRIE